MSVQAWRVVGGVFVTPDRNGMKASCHHLKRGACAGCYARLSVLIDEIEKALKTGGSLSADQALELIDACTQARRAESPRGGR